MPCFAISSLSWQDRKGDRIVKTNQNVNSNEVIFVKKVVLVHRSNLLLLLLSRWYIFYSFQLQAIQIRATQEQINTMHIHVVSDAPVVNFIWTTSKQFVELTLFLKLVHYATCRSKMFHNVGIYIWKECSLKKLLCLHLHNAYFLPLESIGVYPLIPKITLVIFLTVCQMKKLRCAFLNSVWEFPLWKMFNASIKGTRS